MKKFASIAVVVALLLAAAVYYGNLEAPEPDTPEPQAPVIEPTKTVDTSPKTKATADGTLKLAASTSHGYILKGDAADLYATVDVEAIEYKGSERPPLNISIVIDRSGSMAGEKITQAKAAARRLVGMLDADDRIAIVSYGSDATVDFSSREVNDANRSRMVRAINGISVSGGTNLSGGFERGLGEVMRWKGQGTVNRVILMSDGNANIGVTYLPELERMARRALGQGASLSTIGVGLDYNEDLMTRMANEGAGNYYFVDDAATIARAFQDELSGLASAVARNTALILKLADGVELQELYGFPFQRTEGSGDIMIAMAEFSSKQAKNVLLKLRVPGDVAVDKARDIMDVELSYTDLIHEDAPRHQTVALHSVITSEQEKATKSVDTKVVARVQQIEVATSMNKAMELYEKGDTQSASQTIQRAQRQMREAKSDYDLKDESFDRVDNELTDLNAQINSTDNRSRSGRKMIKKKKARSNYIMFGADSF